MLTTAEFERRLAEVDFDSLVDFAVRDQNGPRWAREDAVDAVGWYKRFLFLCLMYPNVGMAVTPEMDTIWHYHILDTRKYFADCYTVLGRYLHHQPFRTNQATDECMRPEVIARTIGLYNLHFGAHPFQLDTECAARDVPARSLAYSSARCVGPGPIS